MHLSDPLFRESPSACPGCLCLCVQWAPQGGPVTFSGREAGRGRCGRKLFPVLGEAQRGHYSGSGHRARAPAGGHGQERTGLHSAQPRHLPGHRTQCGRLCGPRRGVSTDPSSVGVSTNSLKPPWDLDFLPSCGQPFHFLGGVPRGTGLIGTKPAVDFLFHFLCRLA